MIGVGDLVVCVDDAPKMAAQEVLVRTGAVYRVAGLALTKATRSPGCYLEGVVGTLQSNRGQPLLYLASRFRKIEHDKREACETEFVELLNRSKQPVKARGELLSDDLGGLK